MSSSGTSSSCDVEVCLHAVRNLNVFGAMGHVAVRGGVSYLAFPFFHTPGNMRRAGGVLLL